MWLRFFKRYQGVLIFLLNAPGIRWWFRYVLRIHGERSSVGKKRIVAILPNAIWWVDGTSYKAEFRTHGKYSKRLYYAFKWIFYGMHFFDWLIADRFAPSLSFGFNELTAYPDPDGSEDNSTDGLVYHLASGSSWATIRDGAGNGYNDTAAEDYFAVIRANVSSSLWDYIQRGIYLFETGGLGSGATVTAAVMSIYGTNKWDGLSCSPDARVDVVSADPASLNALAAGDFDSLGTTSHTSDAAITYTNWNTSAYNDWTITNLGYISKTGTTKYGVREFYYDAGNTPPNWVTDDGVFFAGYFADQAGTANDPKLVVTYTLPPEDNALRFVITLRSDGV